MFPPPFLSGACKQSVGLSRIRMKSQASGMTMAQMM